MITLCGSRFARWGARSHGMCSAPVVSMSGASTAVGQHANVVAARDHAPG